MIERAAWLCIQRKQRLWRGQWGAWMLGWGVVRDVGRIARTLGPVPGSCRSPSARALYKRRVPVSVLPARRPAPTRLHVEMPLATGQPDPVPRAGVLCDVPSAPNLGSTAWPGPSSVLRVSRAAARTWSWAPGVLGVTPTGEGEQEAVCQAAPAQLTVTVMDPFPWGGFARPSGETPVFSPSGPGNSHGKQGHVAQRLSPALVSGGGRGGSGP